MDLSAVCLLFQPSISHHWEKSLRAGSRPSTGHDNDRLREAVSALGLAQPHHDGSELYVDRTGDSVELRMRTPEGAADAVLLRYVEDGEPRTVKASVAAHGGGEVWWRADLPLRNPVVSYRWLLTGGQLGYRWLNGTGGHPYEVPPTDDFRLNADPGGPEWHLSSVVYEIFIDRFAKSGAPRLAPAWAVRREYRRPAPAGPARVVLRNLLSNALEAGASTVEIFARPDGVICVRDDGPGVAPGKAERIFGVYSDKFGGAGLGLALCREILRRRGGEIWLELPSTFCFRVG